MESVEVSARTVDEAIDIALSELGLKRSQVEIEILTPGKPGLFGLGGEQARVRVTALEGVAVRPAEAEEAEETERQPFEFHGERRTSRSRTSTPRRWIAATEFLRTCCEVMGINADVTVRAPETAADGLGRATAVLDIDGEDLGLLIGRRGATLAALQYLVNVMVTRKLGEPRARDGRRRALPPAPGGDLAGACSADGGPSATVAAPGDAGADAGRRAADHPPRPVERPGRDNRLGGPGRRAQGRHPP